jgi:dethiobiotin synthetase
MPSRFFVTGTDTGIGKTVVSAMLCAGLGAVYWKPIQTGSTKGTDRVTVMRLASLQKERTLPEVYLFKPPVSPHLAALKVGVEIDLRKIRAPEISKRDSLIVEGAGGAFVPVNERQLMTDLMKRVNLPVILVARTALGTINHTLLSLLGLRAAGLHVRAVVMVGKPNDDNRKAIEHYGTISVAGTLPMLARLNRTTLRRAFETRFDRKAFAR